MCRSPFFLNRSDPIRLIGLKSLKLDFGSISIMIRGEFKKEKKNGGKKSNVQGPLEILGRPLATQSSFFLTEKDLIFLSKWQQCLSYWNHKSSRVTDFYILTEPCNGFMNPPKLFPEVACRYTKKDFEILCHPSEFVYCPLKQKRCMNLYSF